MLDFDSSGIGRNHMHKENKIFLSPTGIVTLLLFFIISYNNVYGLSNMMYDDKCPPKPQFKMLAKFDVFIRILFITINLFFNALFL